MLWGAFSYKAVGTLVKKESIMDKVMYKNILADYMFSFVHKNMPRGWIFQQDNDLKHRSGHVQDFFNTKKIHVLEWPNRFPDLNSIEHLEKKLKVKMGAINCSNTRDLWEKV